MELQYEVTEEDCRAAAADLLRGESRRKVWIYAVLSLSFGIPLFMQDRALPDLPTTWLLLGLIGAFGLQGIFSFSHKRLLAIWSAMTVCCIFWSLYFLEERHRAFGEILFALLLFLTCSFTVYWMHRTMLQRLRRLYGAVLSPGKRRLALADDALYASCGELDNAFPFAAVSEIREGRQTLLIRLEGNALLWLPLSVFAAPVQKQAFLDRLTALRSAAPMPRQTPDAGGEAPDGARFCLRFTWRDGELQAGLQATGRAYFHTPFVRRFGFLFSKGMGALIFLGMAYRFYDNFTAGTLLLDPLQTLFHLCMLVAGLMIWCDVLVAFTPPLARLFARRQCRGNLADGARAEITLAFTDAKLIEKQGGTRTETPWKEICHLHATKDFLLLFRQNRTVFLAPLRIFPDEAQAQAALAYLRQRLRAAAACGDASVDPQAQLQFEAQSRLTQEEKGLRLHLALPGFSQRPLALFLTRSAVRLYLAGQKQRANWRGVYRLADDEARQRRVSVTRSFFSAPVLFLDEQAYPLGTLLSRAGCLPAMHALPLFVYPFMLLCLASAALLAEQCFRHDLPPGLFVLLVCLLGALFALRKISLAFQPLWKKLLACTFAVILNVFLSLVLLACCMALTGKFPDA